MCVQAQSAYLEVVEKFGKMNDDVEGLLSERDEAYLELLAVPDVTGAPPSADLPIPCRVLALAWALECVRMHDTVISELASL